MSATSALSRHLRNSLIAYLLFFEVLTVIREKLGTAHTNGIAVGAPRSLETVWSDFPIELAPTGGLHTGGKTRE